MKQHKLILFLVSMLLVISALIAVIIAANNRNTQTTDVTFYYLNSSGTSISPELRTVRYSKDEELPVRVVSLLTKAPKTAGNTAIADKKTTLNSIKYVNDTDVTVDFSKEFITENASHNVLAAYAVTKTLCGLEGIERVKVTVCGADILAPDGTVIDFTSSEQIKTDTEKSPESSVTTTLYYPINSRNAMRGEERELRADNKETMEVYILRELATGDVPDGTSRPVTDASAVLSATSKDGICYVNLSGGYFSKNKSASDKERLMIYAMVNSLTELDSVYEVQFLEDGKKISDFAGVDLSKPLGRDETLIDHGE